MGTQEGRGWVHGNEEDESIVQVSRIGYRGEN